MKMHRLKHRLRLVAFSILLPLLNASAGNLLTNPGFELNPAGETRTLVAWNWYGQSWGNTLGETGAAARTGTNFFKVFQGFTGSVNYNGIYQDIISGPGAVYSADGWAYTLGSDAIAGQNVAWIEVTFRDATANVLALYRSALVTTNSVANGQFPANTWIHLAVTNQYNPVTFAVTNSTAALVAPPRTSFVRYQVVFQGDANNSNGSLYFDDLNLTQTAGAPYGDWNIVWSDEFNGSSINTGNWGFDMGDGSAYGIPGWGNNELEYYTSRSQNAFVSGGLLHIVARQESFGGRNYTSAKLKSAELFTARYGRFEFRAKLPAGVGFWPALWMMPQDSVYGGWPASGEIDVMENNGSALTNVQGTIHYGSAGNDSSQTRIYTLPNGSVTNFHTYVLEWTTNSFNWFVDGLLYETQTNWFSAGHDYPAPFDQPFYLIMNLAIGGNYLGNPGTNTINANSTFPGDMQVDYVRAYQSTAPLKISILKTNASLLLTWPTNIVCHLQAKTNALASSSNWSDLSNATSPLLITPAAAGVFYRLQSP